MFVRMEIGGKRACKPLFRSFLFFNSQFPCNSDHKVNRYATEYVVAVTAGSVVGLDTALAVELEALSKQQVSTCPAPNGHPSHKDSPLSVSTSVTVTVSLSDLYFLVSCCHPNAW